MLLDATHRRMAVTLLCLIVSGTIFTSFFVFIDSYSSYIWDYETDVGPASMMIVGSEGLEFKDAILALPHINKVSSLKLSMASVVAYPPEHNVTPASSNTGSENEYGYSLQPVPEDELNKTIRVGVIDDTFQDNFPSIINITIGRLPESDIEIAFSEYVANVFKVTAGDIVSYEHGVNSIYYSYLRLVGVYSQDEADKRSGHYYTLADAVIPESLMTNDSREDYLFLGVESHHNQLMSSVEVNYLSDVEESIREIDPQYAVSHHTSFYIDDILAQGIVRYQTWLLSTRSQQVTRIEGFLFFAMVFAGFGVRYNIRHKKAEIEMLRARGSSPTRITVEFIRELSLLGILSTGIALVLGFIMSRIGLITVGFFQFSQLKNGPFLIEFDSIVILIILSIGVPLSLYSVLHNDSKAVTSTSVDHGRLARMTRLLTLLRWDLSLSLISLLILLTTWGTSNLVAQSPVFTILAYGAPFTFFIGIAGLITRSLRTSAHWLSIKLGRSLGKLATGLGIRRVGSNASAAGVTVLIIALAISLAWNGAVLNVTLPNTILNQTKFAIGGDVSFRLEDDNRSLWSNLTYDVAENPIVEGLATVTTYGLSLSSDIQDLTEFVAIDPSQYADVGYDSLGEPLTESSLMPSLVSLGEFPTGIIITSDLARSYALSQGDALRAFRANGSDIETLTFNILAIVESLPDALVGPNGYSPPPSSSSVSVGRGRIWMTAEYAETVFSQDSSLATVLCIRTHEGTNGDELVNEVLSSNLAGTVLGYAVASSISDQSSHQSLFIFDSTIDTILTIVVLSSIPVAFLIYYYEQLEDKRKESALLRAIGMELTQLHRYEMIETQSVILYGVLLVAVGVPVLIMTSLNIAIFKSAIAFKAFPSPIILSIPWIPLFFLIAYLFICASVVGFILSLLNSKYPIIEARRETWADSWCSRGQTE